MSPVLTAAAGPMLAPQITDPPSRLRATLALARSETVRLVRHPLILLALVAFVGLGFYPLVSGRAARSTGHLVLQLADQGSQLSGFLLIGSAVLIVANLATTRAARQRTATVFDLLALPGWCRVAAQMLAVGVLAAMTAVLDTVRIVALAMEPNAIGRPDPAELLAVPAVVLLFGVSGVLLGALVQSAAVAPLSLLALLAPQYLLGIHGRITWMLPIGPDYTLVPPLPPELMLRPAGAHLAYLIGLVVLISVLAMVKAGARTVTVLAAGVLALVVVGVSAVIQLGGPDPQVLAARLEARDHPAARHSCERREQVTYCFYPDWRPWVATWDRTVRAVLDRVPAEVAAQPIALRQRVDAIVVPDTEDRLLALGGTGATSSARSSAQVLDDQQAGLPEAIGLDTRWPGEGDGEVDLAGQVAYRVLTGRAAPDPQDSVCGGQAVLLAWLAAQVSPDAAETIRWYASPNSPASNRSISFGPGAGLGVPNRELTTAVAVLTRPAKQVSAIVNRSWTELTAEQTTVERAAEILGVPAAPPNDLFTRC